MSVSEKELTNQARAGNASAFEELISCHQDRVFSLAYHILGDADDAADVQQDTFVRAWKNIRSFHGRSSFGTWLHAITVNSCLGYKRKAKMHASLEEPMENNASAGNRATTACQDKLITSIAVRQLLADIPEKLRVMLILREVEEMSIDEIAQVTNSSYRAVTQQLWRARKLFRSRFLQNFTEVEK